MRLRDLDAYFLTRQPDGTSKMGDTLAGADGLLFQCPKCAHGKETGRDEEKNRGYAVGAHSVICWFVGRVPDDLDPKPGRWVPQGTDIDDVTFVGPAAASVLLTGAGCGWHGFVRDGHATLS